jgi:hypothetical protein
MLDPDITPELLQTIDILEGLEHLYDAAPSDDIADVLLKAWIGVTETFPEDFKSATWEDAGADGLRRYIRVKSFFSNPHENPISQEDLEQYCENRQEIDWENEDDWDED